MSNIPLKTLTYEDLSDKQKLAFKYLKDGHNVGLHGCAGSGKSALLNFAKDNLNGVVITGTTGISAISVKGRTIYSFAGVQLAQEDKDYLLEKVLLKKHVCARIRAAKILVIDEIGFLDAETFDKIHHVIEGVREKGWKKSKLQYLLTGDFAQLNPVNSEEKGLAFESKAWAKIAPKIVNFDKIFRQTDKTFTDVLNKIRFGQVDDDVVALIERAKNNKRPTGDIEPITIFTKNIDVDKYNKTRYDQLTGIEKTYYATDFGHEDVLKMLDKNCPAAKVLSLKVGCQVCCIANVDLDNEVANGSLGIVTGFSAAGRPIVKYKNGHQMEMEYHSWEITELDHVQTELKGKNVYKVVGSRSALALKVAYCSTAHRAQGQTFECARMDLSQVFGFGMVYSSVSRVKSEDGLYITNCDISKIRAHPKVIQFYRDNK